MIDHFWKFEKSDAIHYRSLKNPQSDTAIIFIHGLGGSNRYWSKDYNYLGHECNIYYIDLLGFGYSAKPNKPYDLERHIAALRQFIKTQVTEQKIILVGHCSGANIALAYFRQYPEYIKHVYLLSLAYFPSRKDAERAINGANHSLLTSISDSFFGHIYSYLISLFRPFFMAFGPDFLESYPPGVGHDAYLNTYSSYFGTLRNVIFNQNIPQMLRRRKETRITMIHGYRDTVVPFESIMKLSTEFGIPLYTMKTSGHDFPLFQQQKIIQIISSTSPTV
jgi:pimeloyl-ACP methyl ester carboxylesterase